MTYYRHFNGLEWCPYFDYCTNCHDAPAKSPTGYVKNHCERLNCQPVENGKCLLCEPLTWDDLI